MILFKVNYDSQNTILKSFDEIAEKISKVINLKINNSIYRILDFEFYSYSEKLPDSHTYKNALQLLNNKLYLHGSGVDITFGDGKNHGGILIRSVLKVINESNMQQFDGPQTVATELFSNLYPLDSFQKNELSIFENKDEFVNCAKIIKTKRVGLTFKPDDPDDYYRNLPLRYIIILQKSPHFKQSIKAIERILGEQVINGNISPDEARDILGYKLNSK